MNELITIDATMVGETSVAYRMDCEGDMAWFPKSQITFDVDKSELTAPKWLLQQKFPNEPI
jgi:hypothetical protein